MIRYVLVTAAYNEERFIEPLLESVMSQTLLPLQWIIVSDGSIDNTDRIVGTWAARYPIIRLCRITEDHPRNFVAQVHAINRALSLLKNLDYEFIGNLDADITLTPDYFERLIDRFISHRKLGLAGGVIYEQIGAGGFGPRRVFTVTSVAHACQFFRRSVFEAIGGAYRPLPYGGPDTYAEVSVRRAGSEVVTFEDLPVFHHRPTNGAEGALRGCYRQGKMDFSLGNLPAFEVFKLLRRAPDRPYVLGSLARLGGFVGCYLHGEERAVEPEFISYLRHEQRRRLTCLTRESAETT
jgi:biofilm PGA synthesis N-glycosyltransferase PgaC